MRSKLFASGLAIVLGVGSPMVGAIGFPEGAIAQQNTSEIDRAIGEGIRLFKEGRVESLRKAIGQFEKALELARSAQVKDKQALALFFFR
jgi:hypothetical protein